MSNPLMDLIAKGEGHYNSYNRGTVKENGKDRILPANQAFDFAVVSIDEIRRRQELSPRHPDRIFAVGRYQLIPDTLEEGIAKLKLDTSQTFTPALQDQLFNDYLIGEKRKHVKAYVMDKPGSSLHDAQKAVCLEWASVEDPDTPGHVYGKYEKQGNRMHTRAADVGIALDEMRAAHKLAKEQGLSPEEAWAAAISMGPSQILPAARSHSADSPGGVLRRGSQGVAVEAMQSSLSRLGYTDAAGRPLGTDGHFGDATNAALRQFQREHDLAADGVAGPRTIAALEEAVRVETRSIGRSDADYLQDRSSRLAEGAYEGLAPPAVPGLREPFTPKPVSDEPPARIDAIQAAATRLPADDAIRTLQQNLNTLGMTDGRNEPLSAHGVYDHSTRQAVARFQAERGFAITGDPDENTRAVAQSDAFIADLRKSSRLAGSDIDRPQAWLPQAHQQREGYERSGLGDRGNLDDAQEQRQMPERHRVDQRDGVEQTSGARSVDDPRNPASLNHELYGELQCRMPDASEERLLQFTAACHTNDIGSEGIRTIHVDERSMTIGFYGKDSLSTPAIVDLSQPPPAPEQAVEQIKQYDQQQVQMMEMAQAQQLGRQGMSM